MLHARACICLPSCVSFNDSQVSGHAPMKAYEASISRRGDFVHRMILMTAPLTFLGFRLGSSLGCYSLGCYSSHCCSATVSEDACRPVYLDSCSHISSGFSTGLRPGKEAHTTSKLVPTVRGQGLLETYRIFQLAHLHVQHFAPRVRLQSV